jgi:hypothetical protein
MASPAPWWSRRRGPWAQRLPPRPAGRGGLKRLSNLSEQPVSERLARFAARLGPDETALPRHITGIGIAGRRPAPPRPRGRQHQRASATRWPDQPRKPGPGPATPRRARTLEDAPVHPHASEGPMETAPTVSEPAWPVAGPPLSRQWSRDLRRQHPSQGHRQRRWSRSGGGR